MAKRFTDTDKWRKDWFRDLGSQGRDLWHYLYENCDAAGIFEFSPRRAEFDLGFAVDLEMIRRVLGGKVVELESGRLFFPAFIEFQYGELSPDSRPHVAVIRALEKRGINPDTLQIGYPKGILGVQDKDKDKEQDKDKEPKSKKPKTRPTADHPLVTIWNQHRGELPECRGVTGMRKTHADTRWDEKPNTEYWSEVVIRMAKSDFCLGKVSSETHNNWKANFDFLIRPETHLKVLEGRYDNRQGPSPGKPPQLVMGF